MSRKGECLPPQSTSGPGFIALARCSSPRREGNLCHNNGLTVIVMRFAPFKRFLQQSSTERTDLPRATWNIKILRIPRQSNSDGTPSGAVSIDVHWFGKLLSSNYFISKRKTIRQRTGFWEQIFHLLIPLRQSHRETYMVLRVKLASICSYPTSIV